MIARRLTCLWRFGLCLGLLAVLLSAACDRHQPPPPTSPGGEELHFTGTLTVTGDRQVMSLGPKHEAAVFRLSGSLLLSGEQRPNTGFKADVIGFVDSRTGLQGRATWTDERGEKIYSELHSDAQDPEQTITGRFIGGTGRYAAVTGEYTFKWQRLTDAGNGKLSGRVVDLRGRVRLTPPSSGANASGGRP